ncbi:MAG: M14 family metallocarboxypeptidase [Pseudomonadota bacterium]
MNLSSDYPIGTPGQKWGGKERAQWLAAQVVQRSYQEEVLAKLLPLERKFKLHHYGALSFDQDRYPLWAATTRQWQDGAPVALITGGVHGYETSGVQGALRFLQTSATDFEDRFNLIVTPCISPWGYETINRWNPGAIDPNRSFVTNSDAEESAAVMRFVRSRNTKITVHIDLHETTDTDNSEFRPALSARDNVEHAIWDIPDGFYLVGDTDNPVAEFQAHIIEAVSQVTHIAPADEHGKIIGEPIEQHGVINYATKALGLCTGFSDCLYGTTTEVYPDSPLVDDENCILAQVAAVTSGLEYVAGKLVD